MNATDPAGLFSKTVSTLCLALVAAWLLPLGAPAAENAWDSGGADHLWTTALNWTNDVVPTSDTGLDLFFGATANPYTNAIGTNITIRSLNFTAAADNTLVTRCAQLAAGGNAQTLTFGGAGGAAITSDAGAAGNFTLLNGNMAMAESMTITHNGSGLLNLQAALSGAGFALTNNGAGVVALSVSNTFSGGVLLNNGTLLANASGALGQGLLTLGGGTLSNSATSTQANDVNLSVDSMIGVLSAKTLTLSGVITNTGALTKAGAGTLTLSGANTYDGQTLVKAGSLLVAHDNALGSTIGNTVVTNTGVVSLSGGITVAENFEIGGTDGSGALRSASGGGSNTVSGLVTTTIAQARIGAAAGSTLRLTGGVQGVGKTLYLAPSGMLWVDSPITNSGATVSFIGTGGTNYLNVGGHDWATSAIYYSNTVILGVNDALPTGVTFAVGSAAAAVAAESGMLEMNGFNQTVGSLAGSATNGNNAIIRNSSATLSTLTVNQSAKTRYSGVLSGNLALVKQGTGMLTLTNDANT